MAAGAYQLKSDLARVCLPAPERTAYRRLAWANSLCLFFLLIGVTGVQSRLPAQKAVPALERPVPVIAEPLPPAAPPAAEPKPNEVDKPETPPLVAVTIDTPAINFAVPTPGSLLVPLSVAPTPVETPLKKVAPVVRQDGPTTVQSTGKEGDRPAPYPYPHLAEQLGYQGTVILLLTVDDAGKVVSADIHQSSGSMILDANAQEWVRRHWIVPPVNGGHLFLAPIRYQLRSG
jgi:TonB family protein